MGISGGSIGCFGIHRADVNSRSRRYAGLERDHVVIVKAGAAGLSGLGYSYADVATAKLIDHTLKKIVLDKNVAFVRAIWSEMVRAIRNLGASTI